jgi:hypothetical protein
MSLCVSEGLLGTPSLVTLCALPFIVQGGTRKEAEPRQACLGISNKNILHGTHNVVGGQRTSLGCCADFLTSLSFADLLLVTVRIS